MSTLELLLLSTIGALLLLMSSLEIHLETLLLPGLVILQLMMNPLETLLLLVLKSALLLLVMLSSLSTALLSPWAGCQLGSNYLGSLLLLGLVPLAQMIH